MDALSLGEARRSARASCARRIARVDGNRRANERRTPPTSTGLLQTCCEEDKRNKKQMTTKEFISALRAAPDNELIFVDLEDHAVHNGYHLTELKAASFETVDCGGKTNRWNETILQLWVPEDAEDTYMKSDKFLSIYDKVRRLVLLDEQAEIRIEYGDENFFPTPYHISDWREDKAAIRFFLKPPATTCKARDRVLTGKTESCCA